MFTLKTKIMSPEEIIGYNIKRIRREKGMKIETLSKHLNITKGRMSQIENGNCKELTINRITKISELLKVDFFEITCFEPQNLKTIKNQHGNLFETEYPITPEFVSAVIDEFAKRISK